MNDPVLVIQVDKATEDRFGNLADDIDGDRTSLTVNVVQRSAVSFTLREHIPKVRILHDNTDVNVHWKASIITNDIRRGTVVHDLQLAENLLADRRLGVDQN